MRPRKSLNKPPAVASLREVVGEWGVGRVDGVWTTAKESNKFSSGLKPHNHNDNADNVDDIDIAALLQCAVCQSLDKVKSFARYLGVNVIRVDFHCVTLEVRPAVLLYNKNSKVRHGIHTRCRCLKSAKI